MKSRRELNGDYAGYVLLTRKVPPIKCSVDELAQLPLKTYGTPVSDEDLQYLSQDFETGDDGAVYIKSYRGDGKYIKIQNKMNTCITTTKPRRTKRRP